MPLENLLYPPHDYNKKSDIVDAIGQASQSVGNIESEDNEKELRSISRDLDGYVSDMQEFISDVLQNDYHVACTIYLSNTEEFSFPFLEWENAKGLNFSDCKNFLDRIPKSNLLMDSYSIIHTCKMPTIIELFKQGVSQQYDFYYKEQKTNILTCLLFADSKNIYNLLKNVNEENIYTLNENDINLFLSDIIKNINHSIEEKKPRTEEKTTKLAYLKPLAMLTHLALSKNDFSTIAEQILNQVDKEHISTIFSYLHRHNELNFYCYRVNQTYRPYNVNEKMLNQLVGLACNKNGDSNNYFYQLSKLFFNELENRIEKNDFASSTDINAIKEKFNVWKIEIEKKLLENSIENIDNDNNHHCMDKKRVKI